MCHKSLTFCCTVLRNFTEVLCVASIYKSYLYVVREREHLNPMKNYPRSVQNCGSWTKTGVSRAQTTRSTFKVNRIQVSIVLVVLFSQHTSFYKMKVDDSVISWESKTDQNVTYNCLNKVWCVKIRVEMRI